MELKIEKLSDIVAWADGKIRDGGYYEEKYKNDALSAYCCVKAHELWRIRDVALKAMERHSVYTNALNKDIADKAAKIDLLEKEIDGCKESYTSLKELVDKNYIPIGEHNDICKKYEDKVAKLEKESEKWQDLAKMNRDTICDQYGVCEEFKKKIAELEKELADCKVKIRHQKENLDGINKTLEIRTKENESLIKVNNNQQKEIDAHEAENARLTEKIKELKKEIERLNRYTKNLDKVNHDLVIKVTLLESDIESRKKSVERSEETNSYWKDQCVRYQDKIKELKEENSYLKKECKNKNDIIKKAYVRYVDEACKGREEIMNECYEKLTEDDTGFTGFKQYTLRALEAQEGDEKEAKNFICKTADIIFRNKRSEDNRKEETEVKVKSRTSSGRYPCGAKVNDIPCSVYRRIKELSERIRTEVDKKRIVDIGDGAEKNLGVSRELFDAAIKALVDFGYQEIIGRIPQATNSSVYIDMHVLATPDVETKETANAENIKSLDFDIPCGEDAIE